MKTVADLRIFLEKNKLSPEDISPKVNISNMTLRRLLSKPGQTKIPDKYLLQLERLIYPDFSNVENMLDYLVDSGESATENVEQVKTDFDEKLHSAPVDQSFKDKLKTLAKIAFSSENRKAQAVALGALLYFINPFDLIPDYLPLGYVDDLGVITLALGTIAKMKT